jgi:hypothetical protein
MIEADVWSIIERIVEQADRKWEKNNPRMEYVSVRIDKRDLDVLTAAVDGGQQVLRWTTPTITSVDVETPHQTAPGT